MRRASAARKRRPVSSIPIANGSAAGGSIDMPPSSGSRPTRASRNPKLAFSAATTMSQPSTISKPPPSAWPLTRAITGTSSVSRSAMPEAAGPRVQPVVEAGLPPSPFMSAPAQKARSPAPVSTTRAPRGRPRCDPRSAAARPRSPRRRRSALRPVDGDARDVVADLVADAVARSSADHPRLAQASTASAEYPSSASTSAVCAPRLRPARRKVGRVSTGARASHDAHGPSVAWSSPGSCR